MATKSNPSVKKPEVEAEAEVTEASEAPEAPEAKLIGQARLDKANDVVQRNIYWAMGAGVLPLPVIDLVAITGVQLNMLRQLSALYGVPFREGIAKKAVTSLLVGLGGVGIGGVIGASLFKLIPFVGSAFGAVSVPVISGMLTHAVGRTFVMHFEAGGTLLDFNPRIMRDYFRSEFSDAKDVVADVKHEGGPATTTKGSAGRSTATA